MMLDLMRRDETLQGSAVWVLLTAGNTGVMLGLVYTFALRAGRPLSAAVSLTVIWLALAAFFRRTEIPAQPSKLMLIDWMRR